MGTVSLSLMLVCFDGLVDVDVGFDVGLVVFCEWVVWACIGVVGCIF